jgi:hypothetical protein
MQDVERCIQKGLSHALSKIRKTIRRLTDRFGDWEGNRYTWLSHKEDEQVFLLLACKCDSDQKRVCAI